ncbi:MAG: hypothetical protein LBR08_02220 [Bacteroidales bacterium]|jgi:hypothetical protein|nr:hypothetical protein [Bacteroidales bacterium]
MMNSKKISTLFFIAGTVYNVGAQAVVEHEKNAYTDSLNRYYIQTEQPLYLYLSTKPNDPHPTPVANSNSGVVKNTVEPMYLDGNGLHTIQHYDAICHTKVVFYVYADGVAPVTQSNFSGSVATVDKTLYYGKDLDISLNAKDDLSGIACTYYSINGAAYQKYDKNTHIPVKQGANVLKYYSADHVGNMEKVKEKTFTVDDAPPITYHTVTGIGANNAISVKSIIYLQPADAVSGIARTAYRFDDGEEQAYNGKFIPTQQLSEGDHTLYYYSVDKVNNRETARSLKFYLDKTAPIVATDVLGDKFIINDQIYFSGRTKMKLTAVDNKIGVKETKYSINDANFVPYVEPFYLPSKPGIHTIRYFAVDSLDNSTVTNDGDDMRYTHTVNKVYVDLTGPSLAYRYKGPVFVTRDTTFISSATEIALSGSDNESGLQKLAYTLDKNPVEIAYNTPVTIEKGGVHSMNVVGYDNVNNRNFIPVVFVVDNMPPVIRAVFSVDPIGTMDAFPVYPAYVQLFVAPTDNLTGIDKITYSVNGQPDRDYRSYIDGFRQEQKYEVKLTVSDKLGNTEEKIIYFHVKNSLK